MLVVGSICRRLRQYNLLRALQWLKHQITSVQPMGDDEHILQPSPLCISGKQCLRPPTPMLVQHVVGMVYNPANAAGAYQWQTDVGG